MEYYGKTKLGSESRLAEFIEYMGIPKEDFILIPQRSGPSHVSMRLITTFHNSRHICEVTLGYGLKKLTVSWVIFELLIAVDYYKKGTTDILPRRPMHRLGDDELITPEWRPREYTED